MKMIGVIGAGNMGSAIISGVQGKYKVLISEKEPAKAALLKRRFKIANVDLAQLIAKADLLILAVKPQDCEDVLAALKAGWTKDKVLISIAAGLTTQYLEKRLGPGARVVRTMPNMPAMIGQGVTAICKGRHARPADVRTAENIFNCVGKTAVVAEKLMDAVTATSGSGPAYVFLFAECMIQAASKLGLSKTSSQQLVLDTLKGSVALLEKSDEEPAVLRQKVTSKGGTTQAALDVFFNRQIEQIFEQALVAAKRRAGELAK